MCQPRLLRPLPVFPGRPLAWVSGLPSSHQALPRLLAGSGPSSGSLCLCSQPFSPTQGTLIPLQVPHKHRRHPGLHLPLRPLPRAKRTDSTDTSAQTSPAPPTWGVPSLGGRPPPACNPGAGLGTPHPSHTAHRQPRSSLFPRSLVPSAILCPHCSRGASKC